MMSLKQNDQVQRIATPALRYHGGKFRIAPWIISHFPPHKVYVECFGGAAGVLLQKPRSYAEVYNDLDGDIVNFFRVVRDPDQCLELQRRIVLTPYARTEFEQAYEETDDLIEQARRLCIRAQMGFGSAGATKGKTGFRIDTRRSYGTAQHLWARYPDVLSAIGIRFAGVLIEKCPAVEVMVQQDGSDTLHSVRVRGKESLRYYRHEMSDGDHEALLQHLKQLKGYVIVSGYETDLYKDVLSDWHTEKTEARISAGRGCGIRTEVIWMNPSCRDAIEMNQGIFSVGEVPA